MGAPTSLPQMLLIGASGRNRGKTALAVAVIARERGSGPIAALKITTVTQRDCCPRGGAGCGVCSDFSGGFLLERERPDGGKDAAQLLRAGADSSHWLRASPEGLADGFALFLRQVARDALIVCESNSLRMCVKPGCFVMLTGGDDFKPSAARVAALADLTADLSELGAVSARIAVERTAAGVVVRAKQ